LLIADLNKEVNRDFYLVPEIVINDYNDTLRLDQDGNIVERKRISIDGDLADLKPGEILVTNNILFDFAKSLLRNESYAELDKIVRMMRANPTMKIELSAYTDEIGNAKRNQDLSEDRAFASKQYLLSKNIEADRIISKGYGKLNPIASNKTEEGRQKNRRVEFKILEK
jgi:outer membrane protein OmpA-like peptidoglycan-associated protein